MPSNGADSQERALLVSVAFSSDKRSLTPAAAQARAARVSGGAGASAVHAAYDHDSRREEFRELVLSAGARVAGEVDQNRQKPEPATLLGSGKVEELAGVAASTHADLVIFDHDLSATQLRNLEDALPCRVIDRTQLILDIFARHARTREGQLQVELAQLEYMLPRLTGRGKAMSQLGGGIGTRGPGETQLETDRRRIQRRVLQLRRELEAVRRTRAQQRQRREAVPVPTVALVGYTNAGKSTLFNAITQRFGEPARRSGKREGVLESARMFATLDPKLSAIQLASRRKVLLSDTVGFIRDLPHTLVTSFRATLEEVRKAEVLLHVRDASSPMGDEHKAEVEKVLAELDVLQKPRLEVLNKIDLLSAEDLKALRTSSGGNGDTILVSAKEGTGIDALMERIDAELMQDPIIEQHFQIPQSEGDALAALEGGAVIRERKYEGNLVRMTVAGPASLLGRYRQFRKATQEKRS